VNADYTLETWAAGTRRTNFPGTPDRTPDELFDLMRTCLGE